MEQKQSSNVECATCGHVGGPFEACKICHGNGGIQSRAFSRTEQNQGLGKDEKRYGPGGSVAPKIVNLPGSFNPSQG